MKYVVYIFVQKLKNLLSFLEDSLRGKIIMGGRERKKEIGELNKEAWPNSNFVPTN